MTPQTPITGRAIRRIVLERSYRAGVGHIGSSLSVADLLAAVYDSQLKHPDVRDPDRNRFILSKGHAALALYAALYLKGWMSEEQLASFCTDGSPVGVHPEHTVPGIDFSTGSLGHGLSIGAGSALGARLQGARRRVFVLVSDAECNEGSLWEAAMFASHHGLANLIVLLDLNGQQALGYTRQVLDLSDMPGRWRAFGWDASEVDGHDVDRIVSAIEACDGLSGPPHVIVARTTFGKGVSFMERQIKWHYWPMSEAEYRQAISELEDRS
ncbi:MAG: transketolase [Candidatus Riflebacteria bacterium]|nr:transketolase [Candidatus Riflebacteria bacterium]